MKSAAVATTLLAAAALAQPHGHHRRHQHDKRELVVEWETVEETITVMIDEFTTETIYPSTTAEAVTTSSGSPGQFFQAASTSSSSVAAPSTTLVVQPSTEKTYAPAPTTTSTTPVAAPTTTTTLAAAAVPTTTYVAPAPASTATGSSGTEYSGDMTYYQIGLGSCGYDDSGLDLSKPVVAISSTFWDSVSSLTSYGINQPAHPFCDQEITIKYNGKTMTGVVRDRCPGCPAKGIDVSEMIFDDLVGGTGAGRVEVEWSFNSGKW